MVKKYIFKTLFCCISLLFIVGCQEEYDTKEVYKKIVYIVNGNQIINPFVHPFTGEQSTGFISVYCSGSLMTDKDVVVKLEYDEEIVEKYNFTEFENDISKYVVILDPQFYEIPNYSATIKTGEPSANLLINVNPDGLSPDTTYVIPLKITSLSDPGYEISEKLSSILYSVKVKNDYSGLYSMVGTLIAEGSVGEPQEIFRNKNVVPISKNRCRMFFAAENELKENIADRTLQFIINGDNSITIIEENDVLDLGGSYYESGTKEDKLILNYSFETSGIRYEAREKLMTE